METHNEKLDEGKEEAFARAKAAGLRLKPDSSTIQRLNFSPDLNEQDFRLIELPKNLLESLQEGERLTIRGSENEDAVLCTRSSSYEIKMVDVSNTMLIAPSVVTRSDLSEADSLQKREILAAVKSYYELRPCLPRLEKLAKMLMASAYAGPDSDRGKGYLEEDLLREVQASEDELREGLYKLNAFYREARWRILDGSYEEKVMTSILGLLDEKNWSYMSVPADGVYAELEEGYPQFVLEHCLNCYGRQKENDSNLYCFDEVKVCQFFGEYLLKVAGKFSYEDFTSSWQQSVPRGMTTHIEQLRGLAMWELAAQPPVIWYFPARNLPRNAAERFAELFKARPKWTLADIEPYISDLAMGSQSINALLLKYARSSTDSQGQRLYNSKGPVQRK
eukprot:m.175915 g.175915  ORF g.175915 m.175915 type:complete len:392 (+) comp39135_c0_seq5:168-1343(+)